MTKKDCASQIYAMHLGFAIADALGVPAEFQSREKLQQAPVRDYQGYGAHCVPAGTWSDDTSMTLAALDSLAHGLDYTDMMARFVDWVENAAYTATGLCFDIGNTTRQALSAFARGIPALECGLGGDYDNGNGSLMRIIPAALYARWRMTSASVEVRLEMIHNVSRLTHSHPRSCMGCGIYSFVLWALMDCPDKGSVQEGLSRARQFYESLPGFAGELAAYGRLLDQPATDFAGLEQQQIWSSGYVVDTLEAALWCLLNTDSYADCVLKAVNLGSDTDTVAAVAGGLAGVLYGLDAIPQHWRDGLLEAGFLCRLCDQFVAALDPENPELSVCQ